MPRLLSINSYNYRRGGSDVVFLEHDAMFRARGWDTAVMTMHHPKNEPSEWSPYFADEIEFGHEYGFVDKIGMAGKVIYSLEAKRKLSALLDKFPADVAHAHCIYHHLSPSVLVELKRRGIPAVMTAHDLKIACPAYKMLNRGGICEKCRSGNLIHVLANRCLRDSRAVSALVMVESMVHKSLGLYRRNLDRVVVPSRFYGQKLQEWGWPEEQLVYIPNYVDSAAYAPRFEAGRYFLYFGRLAQEKGVATLMRAAGNAGVPLRIAGTGPEADALKELAARQGGDIEFLGYVAGDRLWQCLREARAVVLPSEWYENAPMAILEAYAMGKPVIGARIGGIPEMVVEDRTGALFASGDADALAETLRRFADMPDAAVAEMGGAARAYVAQTFTAERYFSEMVGLYAEPWCTHRGAHSGGGAVIAQIDKEYLAYGVGRAARRIASYGLYEGRPLTTKGRFINPLVFAWLRTLAALPGDPQVDRPVFITGLGRSGTTILGILLSLHREVGYLNEPKALWHVIDPRQDINGNYCGAGARFRLTEADVDPHMRRRAHRLFSRYLRLTGSGRVVDKYPELIFRVGYVRAMFPDARFVFITRSGADAVPSVVEWSKRLGVKSGGHTDDWWGRDDIKWAYLRNELLLADPAYETVWSVATSGLDHANRAALEWIVTMREGLAQQHRHPDAVIRVSYESLLAEPGQALSRLQEQCGLQPDPSVAAYAKKRLYGNPAKEWPDLHPAVDALFRETTAALGYDLP